MQTLDTDQFQYRLLRSTYRMRPFDLKGGLRPDLNNPQDGLISCLIIASNRPKELDLLLEDLSLQTLTKGRFEVVVLNDGGGDSIRSIVAKYEQALDLIYSENAIAQKVISNLRNKTVEMSQGEYILFLDDDTRIFQKDFLATALDSFHQNNADVILVEGEPLYGLVKEKYCFLDAYSFATRCCLYRRKVLEGLGGFMVDLNSYEDIELSIRAIIKNLSIYKSDELSYAHPPLYFHSLQKPLSIGQSIFQMRSKYSFLTWGLIYLNALRFLPYGLVPSKTSQQWFKISVGVLAYPLTGKSWYY